MKQTTRQNYRHRITRVIDYIHNNLGGDLSVNVLADIAIMSPYHFHRIYRELAQETVNATIRRLRLQRAAVELIRSTQPISRIAKRVSYGSQEAFSRAFTQQFGETPGEYRQARKTQDQIDMEPFIAMLPTETKVYEEMYQVDIIDLEPIPLSGYRHQGDYMGIGATFEKLFIYGASNNLLNEHTRSIGLYYDDPKTVVKEELRSMACITTAEDTQMSGDNTLERMQIPAGKCATLLFKGSYAELEKPYDWLFGHWLPQSGHEAADFPVFEEYLNDPKETPPSELLTRIHCLLA
ncbi:MAG: AraC family transcriptional regulator [Candidatus Thiodiazotropha sp. (ex Dulcina madagascariensis)]|nr:AraC family transcriptional regulator [Candidatus Thiodiazotropha sp. (ex Epidulcina cf. delphinae)]MCU7921088.1 AraC family transcriptional regulator [Candidatus Thiodiazotropha sp. (ex Dulcina madagascariensis)]MCU7928542.1 AraC family transcriptional regulator [Candidatus Thiodiazotropha sp. (ex Dulcina madagascariensis)]